MYSDLLKIISNPIRDLSISYISQIHEKLSLSQNESLQDMIFDIKSDSSSEGEPSICESNDFGDHY